MPPCTFLSPYEFCFVEEKKNFHLSFVGIVGEFHEHGEVG